MRLAGRAPMTSACNAPGAPADSETGGPVAPGRGPERHVSLDRLFRQPDPPTHAAVRHVARACRAEPPRPPRRRQPKCRRIGLGWYDPRDGGGEGPGLSRNIAARLGRPQPARPRRTTSARRCSWATSVAATGTPVEHCNCHPFRHGDWLFQHNGFIEQHLEHRRDLLLAVDPSLFALIDGTTDSQLLFFLGTDLRPRRTTHVGALERMAGFVEATGHCPRHRRAAAEDDRRQRRRAASARPVRQRPCSSTRSSSARTRAPASQVYPGLTSVSSDGSPILRVLLALALALSLLLVVGWRARASRLQTAKAPAPAPLTVFPASPAPRMPARRTRPIALDHLSTREELSVAEQQAAPDEMRASRDAHRSRTPRRRSAGRRCASGSSSCARTA